MGRESKAKANRRLNRKFGLRDGTLELQGEFELTAQQAINADPPTAAPWNTRYLEYARAHERGPEAMLRWDTERFPGGKMVGFILWVSGRTQDWEKVQGEHPDFDVWLKRWVDEATSRIIVPRPAEIVRPR